MASVTKRKYPLNPTLRWTNENGRLTAEGFRIIRAIADVIENVSIVDGEITEQMLADLAVTADKIGTGAVVAAKIAAGSVTAAKISVSSLEAVSATLGNVIIDGDLVVNGTITTSKVELGGITEVTTATQPVAVGPNGNQILLVDVPTIADNTGVLIQYVGFMTLPTANPANVGGWQIYLYRNASLIAATPVLDYDDNYAYPVSIVFIDENAGIDPEYQLLTHLVSGAGAFTVGGGQAIFTQFKR